MLLYLSKNKMENLILEAEIRMNFFDFIRTFQFGNIELNTDKVKLSPFNEINKVSRDISFVLKTLKSKGKLKDLSPDMIISPLSYITSKGTIEYIKFEDGYTASTMNHDVLETVRERNRDFFEDDILFFNIYINHENYDKIVTKCTAENIQVFGNTNLKAYYEDWFKDVVLLLHPHSGDPGILYKKISVEFIILVIDTNPNDRSIIGSPIIIYC